MLENFIRRLLSIRENRRNKMLHQVMKYIALSILLLQNTACLDKGGDGEGLPSPDLSGIDTSSLPLKFGNLIVIETEGSLISGVILDVDKDEGGLWYGICFLDGGEAKYGNKLFGRQVPSGILPTTCVDCFDLTYLNENAVTPALRIEKRLSIDTQKIKIGSMWPAQTLTDLKASYLWGMEQRKRTQTACNKVFVRNPVRETYFELNQILNSPF